MGFIVITAPTGVVPTLIKAKRSSLLWSLIRGLGTRREDYPELINIQG